MNGGEKALNNFLRKLFLENTLQTSYSKLIVQTPGVNLRLSPKFCEATLKDSRFKTRLALWGLDSNKYAGCLNTKFFITPNFRLTLYDSLTTVVSAKHGFGEQSHPIYVTLKSRLCKDMSFSSKLKLGPRFDGAIVRSYTYVDANSTCFCFDADFPQYGKFFASAGLDKIQLIQPPLIIAYEVKNYSTKYRFVAHVNKYYIMKASESLKIPIGRFKIKIGQYSENLPEQEYRNYRNIICGLSYSDKMVSIIYDRINKKFRGINSTLKLHYNQKVSISSRIVWEFGTSNQSTSFQIKFKDV